MELLSSSWINIICLPPSCLQDYEITLGTLFPQGIVWEEMTKIFTFISETEGGIKLICNEMDFLDVSMLRRSTLALGNWVLLCRQSIPLHYIPIQSHECSLVALYESKIHLIITAPTLNLSHVFSFPVIPLWLLKANSYESGWQINCTSALKLSQTQTSFGFSDDSAMKPKSSFLEGRPVLLDGWLVLFETDFLPRVVVVPPSALCCNMFLVSDTGALLWRS